MSDRVRPLRALPDDDTGRISTEYQVVRTDRCRREDAPRKAAPSRSERRQFARHSLALVVQLRFESLDSAVHSESVDLSRSGIFLRTALVRSLGTAVQLRFELDGRRVDVRGVVVRHETKNGKTVGMGIAFDEPLPADAGIFDELIARRAERAAR